MIPVAVRQDVDKLLEMYKTYKQLAAGQSETTHRLAKARLKGGSIDQLENEHHRLSDKMQSISDAMIFPNPLVWALYKFEAYIDEAQPICTMQDFRLHCSKPGYICTKRFIFVNKELNQRGLLTLSDIIAYPDHESLATVFKILDMLSQDNNFMKGWELHEYYKHDGMVAKWENFIIE